MNINLTIIGQSLSFIVFAWFCMKFIWPPIINALRERQRQIAQGLEQAEQAEQNMELAKQKSDEIIEQAKQNAQEIIEQANHRSDQLIEKAKQQAAEESKRLHEAAQSDIEQEVNRAREGLREQVSELVISGVEKVLQTSVDRKQHDDTLRQLSSEL